MKAIAPAVLLALVGLAVQPRSATVDRVFDVAAPGEVVATVRARCERCSWGETSREAVALSVSVDGKYSQHIVLVRGETGADYRITLGAFEPGRHRLTIGPDPALSAAGAGPASIEAVGFSTVGSDRSTERLAQSMAPILHARPNTIGRFTDVPLVMWYEIVPTARGRQFRYSVVFSNEDGGTPTDRLMATWGRTTDIEFVYGVEVDAGNRVLAEEFQGPGHEVPAFAGRHERAHPLLYVSTDNNMVSAEGSSTVRYAPAPTPFDLRDVSREVVMDRHPWTYAVAAAELGREGKIDTDAAAGSGRIPDPRRYVYLEACSDLKAAALAFAIRAADPAGAARWYDSDRGLADFRIVRTGCFRGAVPISASATRIDAVRFSAYARPPQNDPSAAASVVLTRVNTVFTLDDSYVPRQSMFSWTGSTTVPIGGSIDLPFRK